MYVHSEGLADDIQTGAVHFQSGSGHSLESGLKSVHRAKDRVEGFTPINIAGSLVSEKDVLPSALTSEQLIKNTSDFYNCPNEVYIDTFIHLLRVQPLATSQPAMGRQLSPLAALLQE